METEGRTADFPDQLVGSRTSGAKIPSYFCYLPVRGITARSEFTTQGIGCRGSNKDFFASPLTLPGINVYWITLVSTIVISCSISTWIVAALRPGTDIS